MINVEVKIENPHVDWNKWVTASVGVGTAVAGIFQFYYLQIFAPTKVPVNIALSLEINLLKPDSSNGRDTILVFMQIKISNTGNKVVYLKSPSWMAFGMHRNGQPRSAGTFTIPTSPESLEAWCSDVKTPSQHVVKDVFVYCWNQKMAPLAIDSLTNEIRLQELTDRIELPIPEENGEPNYARELIATGPLGKEKELKPGQVVQSHILIPVSTKPHYDYLEAVIAVPTVSGIPSEQADKIASVAFINLQDQLPTSPPTLKVYQRLRSFCLTKPRPSSLVNVLDLFKLPRRYDGEVSSSLGKQVTGNCYTSAKIPQGLKLLKEWGDGTLRVSEFDRFGAQFYDATFEVPLYPYGQPLPAIKGVERS